ncbi:hypothetical protein [Flavobacterium caseinilyticum]|uniref:Secreted protein n=1 Tax=Flavobacterium caseinilyticum TaxID=2541732 RepID=A0A4V2YUP2_9FLAO|nr:hypothetical protein [Flavobacterium caseinilyticum]TDD78447.1 hypothetical protein E0F89_02090 [Flavobacterium caseinilyticum]
MSVKITLLLLSFCCISFAQESKQQKITIFLDFNDKLSVEYSINKDTTSTSFGIFFEKYQTKEARDKATKDHYNDIRDRNSAGLPDFSVNLYVFSLKPEKLNSLDCIDYITVKQFRENNYKTTSPTYIIHKLKDGTYLKWKTFTMN